MLKIRRYVVGRSSRVNLRRTRQCAAARRTRLRSFSSRTKPCVRSPTRRSSERQVESGPGRADPGPIRPDRGAAIRSRLAPACAPRLALAVLASARQLCRSVSSNSLIVPLRPSSRRSLGRRGSYTPSPVDDTCFDDAAQVNYAGPVAAISRKSTCLQGKHRADGAGANKRDQVLEARPLREAAAGSAKVAVNDMHLVETMPASEIRQSLLLPLPLDILVHLTGRRLTNADGRSARRDGRRQIRHPHPTPPLTAPRRRRPLWPPTAATRPAAVSAVPDPPEGVLSS